MHPIRRLLAEFEGRDRLPVEPEEVREWIEKNGFCDELTIHYPTCHPDAFAGIYIEKQGQETVRRTSVYGDVIVTREIFVNKNQPLVERRLAEVKEQIHILDSKVQRTSTPAGVDSIINYVATGIGSASGSGPANEVLTDMAVALIAAQILFPMKARELLKPAVAAKVITIDEIANQAVLSAPLVERILEDDWLDLCLEMSAVCEISSVAPMIVRTQPAAE